MIDKIKIRILGTFASGNNISNINQIINRSHQDLQNIGTKTHEQLETEISDINTALNLNIENTAEIQGDITNINTNLNGKVNIIDIQDVLNSIETNKPLSANQGRVLKEAIDNINLLLASDEITLDTLQEIVDFIQQNKEILDTLTISNIAGLETALTSINTQISNLNTNKVNVSDVIDNLISTETAKPLSANQGRELKNLIDNIPTGGSSTKSFETVYGLDKTIGSDIVAGGYVFNQDDNKLYRLPTGALSTQNLNDVLDKIFKYDILDFGIYKTGEIDLTSISFIYGFGNNLYVLKTISSNCWLYIYDCNIDGTLTQRGTLDLGTTLFSASSSTIGKIGTNLFIGRTLGAGLGFNVISIDIQDLDNPAQINTENFTFSGTGTSAYSCCFVSNYIVANNILATTNFRLKFVNLTNPLSYSSVEYTGDATDTTQNVRLLPYNTSSYATNDAIVQSFTSTTQKVYGIQVSNGTPLRITALTTTLGTSIKNSAFKDGFGFIFPTYIFSNGFDNNSQIPSNITQINSKQFNFSLNSVFGGYIFGNILFTIAYNSTLKTLINVIDGNSVYKQFKISSLGNGSIFGIHQTNGFLYLASNTGKIEIFNLGLFKTNPNSLTKNINISIPEYLEKNLDNII